MNDSKRSDGSYRRDRERQTYKRDTVLMICAIIVLFLSPFVISIYSNYQESVLMEQYADQIEESLATASDAGESGEAASEDNEETALEGGSAEEGSAVAEAETEAETEAEADVAEDMEE